MLGQFCFITSFWEGGRGGNGPFQPEYPRFWFTSVTTMWQHRPLTVATRTLGGLRAIHSDCHKTRHLDRYTRVHTQYRLTLLDSHCCHSNTTIQMITSDCHLILNRHWRPSQVYHYIWRNSRFQKGNSYPPGLPKILRRDNLNLSCVSSTSENLLGSSMEFKLFWLLC
jgi:hypothetical protein